SGSQLTFNRLGRHYFNSKAPETHIGPFAGGKQANGGNAEVLENLRAQPNFAPLTRAGRVRPSVAMGNIGDRHAGSSIAKINDNPPASRLESGKRRTDRFRATEHIAYDVGAMQPRQYAIAIANRAIDEGHVMHAIERRHVGVAVQRA